MKKGKREWKERINEREAGKFKGGGGRMFFFFNKKNKVRVGKVRKKRKKM